MNREVVLIAKKNYEQKLKEKKELLELREELEQLKQDEKVQRYLKISNVEWKKPADDEFLIRSSFSGRNLLDPREPKIYFYIGAYNCRNEYGLEDTHAYDKFSADYLMYKNLLDENDVVKTSPSMAYDFESRNIILKSKSPTFINKKFQEIQTIFYEEILNCDSDSLELKKVLEKVKEHL